MPSEFFNQIVRGPRHAGGSTGSAAIRIRPTSGRPAEVSKVINVSRRGVQVVVSSPFAPGDEVQVEIDFTQNSEPVPNTCHVGHVRWCEHSGGCAWRIGIQLREQLSWETFGELFLHDVVSVE